MEGFAIEQIMKELRQSGFKVTTILHDKDSSTLRNVMDIFEDVQEALCLSKSFKFIFFLTANYIGDQCRRQFFADLNKKIYRRSMSPTVFC
jgi:hypothetical protein